MSEKIGDGWLNHLPKERQRIITLIHGVVLQQIYARGKHNVFTAAGVMRVS